MKKAARKAPTSELEEEREKLHRLREKRDDEFYIVCPYTGREFSSRTAWERWVTSPKYKDAKRNSEYASQQKRYDESRPLVAEHVKGKKQEELFYLKRALKKLKAKQKDLKNEEEELQMAYDLARDAYEFAASTASELDDRRAERELTKASKKLEGVRRKLSKKQRKIEDVESEVRSVEESISWLEEAVA